MFAVVVALSPPVAHGHCLWCPPGTGTGGTNTGTNTWSGRGSAMDSNEGDGYLLVLLAQRFLGEVTGVRGCMGTQRGA